MVSCRAAVSFTGPNKMVKLALLRHGHTSWNRAHRIQGRTDIPLDAEAKTALSAYCLPPPWANADLTSSPLKRAADTAALVADRRPETSPALMEMDWGDFEGKHGLDLKADPNSGFLDIENWGWNYTPPNGESPADLWARLDPWLKSLRRNTVAVCHIGVMRVLLARAHGWDFDGPAPFKIKRNWLFLLDINNGLAVGDPERVKLSLRQP